MFTFLRFHPKSPFPRYSIYTFSLRSYNQPLIKFLDLTIPPFQTHSNLEISTLIFLTERSPTHIPQFSSAHLLDTRQCYTVSVVCYFTSSVPVNTLYSNGYNTLRTYYSAIKEYVSKFSKNALLLRLNWILLSLVRYLHNLPHHISLHRFSAHSNRIFHRPYCYTHGSLRWSSVRS
jgi:hypothetical protein